MQKNFNRVACYLRVSTENQIENYSIAEQKERLEAFCKAKDYNVFNYYIDPGYSGGNIERPALQQMLKDIHSHKIDMVVVYKLDRLSRSQKDTLNLIEDEFIKNNVEFVSVNENFDTSTPFGRAMIGILSVFAQLEKDQITERFTMGRIGRAKNGLFHGGGNTPTGYDYIDGKLVINEYEAIQVKEIFDRFLKGESINSIQAQMHIKYTNKNGGWSSATSVYNAIKNSIYIGKTKFKGEEYEGMHQPIIDVKIFEKANTLLCSSNRSDTKNSAQKTPFRAGYLLSSLVYCGNCGAKYSAGHGYYSCYSRNKTDKKYIIDPRCNNIKIKISDLDNYIKCEILTLSFNPDRIKNYNCIDNKDSSETLKKQLKLLDTQIEKLIDMYQFDNIDSSIIKSRIDKVSQEKIKIQQQLDSTQNDSNHNNKIAEFINNLSKCQRIFKSESIEEQRLFISTLIDKITVMPDSKINIKWRL